MAKAKLTTEDTLLKSDGGFKYFKSVFPQLKLRSDDNTKCISIDSPFHNERPKSLSIYLRYGKWNFSDHAGQSYWGDVFKFVAYTKKLNYQKDYYKILQIINETVEGRNITEENSPNTNEEISITYSGDYACKILFKKYFDEICGDLSNTQFKVKLVEKARFLDETGEVIELESDLKDYEEIYFSFANPYSEVELIYNPRQQKFYYACKDGALPSTYLFGWYEALMHMNFSYPDVAGNLIITNSIENTLLIQSLGFPAIGLLDENKETSNYLLQVVLPQCNTALIFFDKSKELDQAAKKLAKKANIPILEFSQEMLGYAESMESVNKAKLVTITEYHEWIDSEHLLEYLDSKVSYNQI